MIHVYTGTVIRDSPDAPPLPMVMAEMRFAKGGRGRMMALADSGADEALMPAAFLPEGVEWGSLTRTERTYSGVGTKNLESRIFHCGLYVEDVLIANHIHVSPPDPGGSLGVGVEYAILGRKDLFAHFILAFAWGSSPPVWTLQNPHQVTSPSLPMLRAEPGIEWLPDAPTFPELDAGQTGPFAMSYHAIQIPGAEQENAQRLADVAQLAKLPSPRANRETRRRKKALSPTKGT